MQQQREENDTAENLHNRGPDDGRTHDGDHHLELAVDIDLGDYDDDRHVSGRGLDGSGDDGDVAGVSPADEGHRDERGL